MTLIKRYPNRKLYNSEKKEYITLDGIANLVRQGDDIQIVDYSTGEDITAITLTQVILEQARRMGDHLPRSFLLEIIQFGNERITNFQQYLSSSMNFYDQVDAEIIRRIEKLTEVGEIDESQSKQWIEKLISQGSEMKIGSNPIESNLQMILQKMQIPTKNDMQVLFDRINELTIQIDAIVRKNQIEETD